MTDELVADLAAALTERFEALARHAVRGNSRVWHGVGERRTRGSALECWVTFNRSGTAGEEDLVVYFGFARFGRGSTAAIDVSTGEGDVLADGPTADFSTTASREVWQREVDAYLGEIDEFMADILPVVESHLW